MKPRTTTTPALPSGTLALDDLNEILKQRWGSFTGFRRSLNNTLLTGELCEGGRSLPVTLSMEEYIPAYKNAWHLLDIVDRKLRAAAAELRHGLSLS